MSCSGVENMIDWVSKPSYEFKDLEEIVRLLRAPGGCPWDREQTHESIRRNFLEEAYEVAEAIDEGSLEHLKEELGDVLLQVVFHAQIENELGHFTVDDVADGVCKKLIFRHPHVFSDTQVSGSEEVLVNWEELKRTEKHQSTHTDALNAVARSLPALWRAEKVQKKAKKAGFDWDNAADALNKLSEEVEELKQAVAEQSNIEEELGDVLFAAVNVSRFVKADAEDALTAATDKFIRRFARVEALCADQPMEEHTLEELDALWNRAKEEERSGFDEASKRHAL